METFVDASDYRRIPDGPQALNKQRYITTGSGLGHVEVLLGLRPKLLSIYIAVD